MSKLLYTHFTKLIINYLLSLNKSIPCRSDSKLHSSQDDHPITKLLSTTNGEFKFVMEVLDTMISDAIKKQAEYKYYMVKKVESEKAKIVDKLEEQHVSPIKSGRGKSFMCYDDRVANVPNKLKKDDVPRKTRSLTIAEEAVVAKKFKELIQKDKLTIADLEGARLEWLKVQYNNDVEPRIPCRSFDDKEYEFSYAYLPRLSVNNVEDIRIVIKNKVEDIQLEVESYQRNLNLTKPTMFFEGINQRIPFTMTATHKEVVYLNQYNIKSLMQISEVKKSSDGTLVKIQENLIDMLSKNKLGSGNKRLKGRD
nr:hypothetical protein [Tanacetum cinerariifolium]